MNCKLNGVLPTVNRTETDVFQKQSMCHHHMPNHTFITKQSDPWNSNETLIKVTQRTDKGNDRASLQDFTDSVCVSKSCRKGEVDILSRSHQGHDSFVTCFKEQYQPSTSFDQSKCEVPSYSLRSGVSVSSSNVAASPFILSTAKVNGSDHISSTRTHTFQVGSGSGQNLTLSEDPVQYAFHPGPSQGLHIFTGASSQTSDQSRKVINTGIPRTSALRRPHNGRPHKMLGHKNVTWSESVTRIVDDLTYTRYRTILLNVNIPNERSQSAVLEAVAFMCSTDEDMKSQSVIDMAFKLFWVKHNRFPSSSELYMAISDVNYDEKCLVVEFIKYCESAKESSVVKSFFDTGDDISVPKEVHCPSIQNIDLETGTSFQQLAYVTSGHHHRNNKQHNLPEAETETRSTQQSHSSLTNGSPLSQFHLQSLTAESELQKNVYAFKLPSMAIQTNGHFNFQEQKPNAEVTRTQLALQTLKEDFQLLEIQALKREQGYLKQTLLCVLCKEKPIEVTLLPCGHFSLCASCSDTCYICPICKQTALADVKTFLG